MRHLAKIEAGKVVTSTLADFLEARLEKRIAAMEMVPKDGFWNVRTVSDHGHCYVSIGARIANPRKHAEKLERTGQGRTCADTSMPGIAGVMQRVNASQVSADRSRQRSRELAAWLRNRLSPSRVVGPCSILG